MRVLHIHSSDHLGGGGGTIAMERLHLALREQGVDSRILCGRKTTRSPYSAAIGRGRLVGKAERLLRRATSTLGLHDIHYLNSFRATRSAFYREAELLHFHGTHGFFNYLALPALTRDKPAVFTLHDMWPLTGHCTYSYGCERWRTGCGSCPHLDVHPRVPRDNTRVEWRLKRRVFQRADLTLVTVSRWLTEMARQSPILDYPVHRIPNGVDTRVYRPLDKSQCRAVLGIPQHSKVLMFVALSLEDRRKGGDLLARALGRLPAALTREMVLLILGDGGEEIRSTVGIRTLDLGYVRNDRFKAIAYSLADLFVFPTRADNLPLVLIESLACGTPMVSFDVGGVPDVVQDGVTGVLAPPEDPVRLAAGIEALLGDPQTLETMGGHCRSHALEEFDLARHLRSHIELYEAVLAHRQQDPGSAQASV